MSSIATTLSKIKDAARVGETFAGHTLPRLHSLSDQTRSEAMIPPYIQAAQAVAREGAAALETDRQRRIYLNLCQRHVQDELGRLSSRAAHHNRQQWDRANRQLVEAQIEAVTRWPEDDRHFMGCAENGLSAIENHDAHMGIAPRHIETRQAQFLSRLLTARLQALAPVNIAHAARVYDRHKSWLAPDQTPPLRAYLNRVERIVRAGLLADAIVRMGPKQAWKAKAKAVAAHEEDGDAEFNALLQEAVQARLDEAEQQEALARQTNRNALLQAIIADKTACVEALLKSAPHLALAWDQAEPDTIAGLSELMRLNRMGRTPIRDEHAANMVKLAIGGALHDHPDFHAENLAGQRWNSVPAAQRLVLVELQAKRNDPGWQAKVSGNLEQMRRMTGHRAVEHRSQRLPIFA